MSEKIKVLEKSPGNNSSKRWFAAACLVSAVGLSVAGMFVPEGVNVEVIKAFLWTATVVLVGGTAAEEVHNLLNLRGPK